MGFEEVPFSKLLSNIVDNRGKTCPTADEGLPLIATNCIRNELLYPTYDKVRFVSQQTYSTWFRDHPRPGDILFVNKATPGRVCLVPDPVNFCIAQDMVAVRADPAKIYPKYLFAALRSPIAQERIAQMHVGTLIPHFKKGDFDKLLLPVPGRDAQEFIGDIYFELSAKIDLNRRMNETVEAMAQALFKSWFVDFDPVRAKAEGRDPGLPRPLADLFPDSIEDSGMREIPRGWEVSTVGEHMANLDSKRVPVSGAERAKRQGPYPYHGAAGVMDYVDDYLFDGIHLLVGEDGSVMQDTGIAVTQYVWGKIWVNNHAHVLQGARAVSTEQLYLYFHFEPVAPYVTGAVQQKLSQGRMNAMPFVFAGDAVCRAYGQTINPWFAKLRAGADEARTLSVLRDALLPKLISGELRVGDAERFLSNAI
jgi:type I restriction enzyme S subunit